MASYLAWLRGVLHDQPFTNLAEVVQMVVPQECRAIAPLWHDPGRGLCDPSLNSHPTFIHADIHL